MGIPSMIEPGQAPGGIVFVTYRDDETELGRTRLTPAGMRWAEHLAERDAQLLAAVGGYLVMFDGDTGEQIRGHFRVPRP